jgi:uncharacterized membrane protein
VNVPRKLRRVSRATRAHVRLGIAILLGIATGFIPFRGLSPVEHALIGWNVGVAFYLIAVGLVMARASVADIKKRACEQDEGAALLLILTVGAAIASVGAIFFELAAVKGGSGSKIGYIAIAISTVTLSWIFMHAIFALRYAHDYYGEGERANGLDFPRGDDDEKEPDYWDFVYFSFVIGMTFQVSDVGVTNKWIRRLVVAHGFVSFVFNTAIVALTVNIAGNVI